MTESRDAMLGALAAAAPGRPLREGLDRILQAAKGALIVVGDGPEVLNICSGGFLLDAAFSPQRLSELAKMDGAIILAADASRIARANVHLVPDPNVYTSETGTRHRTAERVARSIGVPVISVSEGMGIIAVYFGTEKHPLEPIPRVLNRANQALQTLERYRNRLDGVVSSLSALEFENLVTRRDVLSVLQHTEMLVRIADEVQGRVVELGTDGRLVRLQLDELLSGVETDAAFVVEDYSCDEAAWRLDEVVELLRELPSEAVSDTEQLIALLDLPKSELDAALAPKGHRMLSKVPRLTVPVARAIVDRFGSLPHLMRASIAELAEVEGVDSPRARALKEDLSRLAESSILDRYS